MGRRYKGSVFKATRMTYEDEYIMRPVERLNRDISDGKDIDKLYDVRIKGAGCYFHQDIKYAIFFKEDSTGKQIIVNSDDKVFFDHLVQHFGWKIVDMYKQCSKCPTVVNRKNIVPLTLLTFLYMGAIYVLFLGSRSLITTTLVSSVVWLLSYMLIFFNRHIDVRRHQHEILYISTKTGSYVSTILPPLSFVVVYYREMISLSLLHISAFLGISLFFFVFLPLVVRPFLVRYNSIMYDIMGVRPIRSNSTFPHFVLK